MKEFSQIPKIIILCFILPIFAQRLNDPYFPDDTTNVNTMGSPPEDVKPYVGPKEEGPLNLEYHFTDLEKNDCQCFCENGYNGGDWNFLPQYPYDSCGTACMKYTEVMQTTCVEFSFAPEFAADNWFLAKPVKNVNKPAPANYHSTNPVKDLSSAMKYQQDHKSQKGNDDAYVTTQGYIVNYGKVDYGSKESPTYDNNFVVGSAAQKQKV